jgi:hypothetical protein
MPVYWIRLVPMGQQTVDPLFRLTVKGGPPAGPSEILVEQTEGGIAADDVEVAVLDLIRPVALDWEVVMPV